MSRRRIYLIPKASCESRMMPSRDHTAMEAEISRLRSAVIFRDGQRRFLVFGASTEDSRLSPRRLDFSARSNRTGLTAGNRFAKRIPSNDDPPPMVEPVPILQLQPLVHWTSSFPASVAVGMPAGRIASGCGLARLARPIAGWSCAGWKSLPDNVARTTASRVAAADRRRSRSACGGR